MTRCLRHTPIALTVALLLGLGVAVALMTQKVSDTSRRLQIANAEQRTTAMRNALTQLTDSSDLALRQIASNLPRWSHEPGNPETSAGLAGVVPRASQDNAVALFDKAGRLLGSSGAAQLVLRPNAPEFAEFWSNAAARGFDMWQGLKSGNGVPEVAQVLASPTDPQVVYVIFETLRSTGIRELLRGYTQGTQGAFALADVTGRITASSVAGQEGNQLPHGIREAALTIRTGVSWTDVNGTPSVVCVRAIGRTGLNVVYYHDTKSLLGNVDSTSQRIVTLVVALMVAAVLAMGVFWFRRQRAVEESADRLTELVANVNDAVLVLRGDEVTFASPGGEALLGVSTKDTLGRRLEALIGTTGAQVLTQLVAATQGRHRPITLGDVPCLAQDGRKLWVEATVADRTHSRSIRGTVISLHDITERRQRSEELMHDATHDQLTGLANRSSFAAAVEKTIARAHRSPSKFAILVLDLDGFKAVNDRHGHAAGDHVLAEIAARLNAVLRGGDLPARLGGDEFAVLVSEVACLDEVRNVATRLIIEINEPISSPHGALRVGVSIGIAMADETDAYAPLIRDADLAMYNAKESGKNTFRISLHRSDSSIPGLLSRERAQRRPGRSRARRHDANTPHRSGTAHAVVGARTGGELPAAPRDCRR